MDVASARECNPVALQWDLLDSLQSAVLVGNDASLGCALVRAEYVISSGLEYWPEFVSEPNIAGYPPQKVQRPVTREMCVDEASKTVLREQLKASVGPYHYVVSFAKIERDPEFGPDEFEIPPNAQRTASRRLQILGDLPVHDCLGSSPSVGCAKNPFALHGN
jgi:hypothetical protein